MSLSAVLASVPATVRRHEATFQRARAVEPALGRYATASALLEAVTLTSDLSTPERQVLVAAILRRHQDEAHPLWQALLLRAFDILLIAMRWRARGGAEEREQQVLLAFLQAVGRVRTDRPVFATVPRAMARALHFAARSGKRAEADHVPLDEESLEQAPSLQVEPSPYVVCLAREIAERMARRPGGADVVRVLAGIETAAEQAERLAGSTPTAAAEEVTGSRLRQRTRRALRDVRAELGLDDCEDSA